MALALFESDQIKTFAEKTINIKIKTKYVISDKAMKVKQWVLHNVPALMVVDEKALLTLAKAKDSIVPESIVIKSEDPQVQFKEDLSDWLDDD